MTGYKVKNADIFGRIGTGVAQGLAETLPKEVERGRLSEGLGRFEQESANLSPMQQVARLSAIPGITPQMIDTLGQLAKQQGLRNAYSNRNGRSTSEIGRENNMPTTETGFNQTAPKFAEGIKGARARAIQQEPSENVQPEEFGQPQIAPKNPISAEMIPRKNWDVKQFEDKLADNWERMPQQTYEQVYQKTKEDEARYLAQPEGEQRIDEYRKEKKDELNNALIKQLETKLQKKGEGVYGDITGEALNNLRRGAERELATNPNASIEDVANKWSTKALDFAKAKTQLKTLSAKNPWALPILANKEEFRHKLEEYSKIYADANNSEEFFNELKSEFNLSPQGAATLAFPTNKNIKSYISNIKPGARLHNLPNVEASAKMAVDLENKIQSSDSLLAIARELRYKDPAFDENAFFDQIRKDNEEGRIGLTQRQKRELSEGSSGLTPHWADILILPFFREQK